MLTRAAECEMASQPAAARSSAARSRISPSTAAPGSPLRLAVRANTTTSWPRAASARTTARPRYPVPPVTRTLIKARLSCSPVLQEIVERLLDRNLRAPSELVAQPAGIAQQQRRIVRAIAGRIDAHL